MSLQSTSSSSNSSSLSNRNSSNSIEFHHQEILIHEHQPNFQGTERLLAIRTDEIYRRRCYRAGLNIFNKYTLIIFHYRLTNSCRIGNLKMVFVI